jgi:hypothetical protein
MKTIGSIALGILLLTSVNCKAQTENPDQNPNYQTSEKKYIEQSEELTKTQSTTIQETYEAYDWTENKAKQKEDRKDMRFEKRKIRYQSRRICRPGYYNGWYSGNGYYNNNFNNGYNNNFNNGYYNNYVPNYNPSNLYNSILLGAGLYYLFN